MLSITFINYYSVTGFYSLDNVKSAYLGVSPDGVLGVCLVEHPTNECQFIHVDQNGFELASDRTYALEKILMEIIALLQADETGHYELVG